MKKEIMKTDIVNPDTNEVIGALYHNFKIKDKFLKILEYLFITKGWTLAFWELPGEGVFKTRFNAY